MAQKKTTDKGNFQIDSLPAGSYIAKITKPGYADRIVNFTIVQGELTSLAMVVGEGLRKGIDRYRLSVA